MGKTVTQLEREMPLEELYEWEHFYEREPWGCEAEDQRWSILYSLTYAAHFKDPHSQPDWLDRDPQETARKKRAEEAVMTLEDKLEAYFAPRRIVAPDDEEQPDG